MLTFKDAQPMPLIHGVLSRLPKAEYITSLGKSLFIQTQAIKQHLQSLVVRFVCSWSFPLDKLTPLAICRV